MEVLGIKCVRILAIIIITFNFTSCKTNKVKGIIIGSTLMNNQSVSENYKL